MWGIHWTHFYDPLWQADMKQMGTVNCLYLSTWCSERVIYDMSVKNKKGKKGFNPGIENIKKLYTYLDYNEKN